MKTYRMYCVALHNLNDETPLGIFRHSELESITEEIEDTQKELEELGSLAGGHWPQYAYVRTKKQALALYDAYVVAMKKEFRFKITRLDKNAKLSRGRSIKHYKE